jgi:hypothetical protein
MVTEWFVAFLGRGRGRHWFDWLTCRGFRHCLAFGFDAESGRWVVYDTTLRATTITLLDAVRAGALIAMVTAQHGRILRFAPRADARLFRPGLWCVPAVAHLLGIRTCALTPRGLYRCLLRRGAVPAFEDVTHGRSVQRAQRPGS